MTNLKKFAIGLCIVALSVLSTTLLIDRTPAIAASPASMQQELSLLTDTPEEGFDLAVVLSRRGVTETQPDRDVLHALRPGYAHDADALIAASQVVAIHFQTVAEANNYWRD